MIVACLRLDHRNYTTTLILALGICTFLVSSGSILPSYKYDDLCAVQGFLHLYFQNLGCITHALIAYTLYKSFSCNAIYIENLAKKLFIGFAVGTLPFSLYPVAVFNFKYAGGWCTISYKGTDLHSGYYWLYTIIRYFFVWGSIFCAVAVYLVIIHKYQRLSKSIINSETTLVVSRMLIFPPALIITYFPITILRCYSQSEETSETATIICIAINSFVGATNCLVYTLGNGDIRYKIIRIFRNTMKRKNIFRRKSNDHFFKSLAIDSSFS